MQPKRIVFVSSLRRYGGGERWMLDTASGLRARGHDARLIARPGSVLATRAPARGIPLTELEMRGDVAPIAVTPRDGWRVVALAEKIREVMRRGDPELERAGRRPGGMARA